MTEATHAELWAACHVHGLEYEGWVSAQERRAALVHDIPLADCSCGCRWFHILDGIRGMDWGVCFNPKSPRCGLLTFEHMGCEQYECEDDD